MLWKLAKKIHTRGPVSAEDLVQAAAVRLMRTRERFDPARGVKWNTYASLHAHGAMLDALREVDHVPRLERKRLKERGEEGRKVLSIDHQVLDVNREGLPKLLDGRAESADFWRGLRRRLDSRVGEVVERYFREEITLKRIGRLMGLSESRVCQLLARGLRHLREVWARQYALEIVR